MIQASQRNLQTSDRRLVGAISGASRSLSPTPPSSSSAPKEETDAKTQEQQLRKVLIRDSQRKLLQASDRQLEGGRGNSSRSVATTKDEERLQRKEFLQTVSLSQRDVIGTESTPIAANRRKKSKRNRRRGSRRHLGTFLDANNSERVVGAATVTGAGTSSIIESRSSYGGETSSLAPSVAQTVGDAHLQTAKDRERQFRKEFVHASQESQHSLQQRAAIGTESGIADDPEKNRERQYRKDFLQASQRSLQDDGSKASKKKKLKKKKKRRSQLSNFLENDQASNGDFGSGARSFQSSLGDDDSSAGPGRGSQTVADGDFQDAKSRERAFRKDFLAASERSLQGDEVVKLPKGVSQAAEGEEPGSLDSFMKEQALLSTADHGVVSRSKTHTEVDDAKERERRFRKDYIESSNRSLADDRSIAKPQSPAMVSREARESEKMGMSRGSRYLDLSPAALDKMGDPGELSTSTSSPSTKEREDASVAAKQRLAALNLAKDMLGDVELAKEKERANRMPATRAIRPAGPLAPLPEGVDEEMDQSTQDITVCRTGSNISSAAAAGDADSAIRKIFSDAGTSGPEVNPEDDDISYASDICSESGSQYESDSSDYSTGSESDREEQPRDKIKEAEQRHLLSSSSAYDNVVSGASTIVASYSMDDSSGKHGMDDSSKYHGMDDSSKYYGMDDSSKYHGMDDSSKRHDAPQTEKTSINGVFALPDAMPFAPQPGAYFRTPGSLTRNPDFDISSVGIVQDTPVPPLQEDDDCLSVIDENSDGTASMDGTMDMYVMDGPAGLVEAMPVNEDEDIEKGVVEAAPVDLAAREAREMERKRVSRRCKMMSVLAVILSALIITLSVIFGKKDPTIEIMTNAPTPTLAPTLAPTQAPVTPCCFLDVPGETLETVQDPTTPQAQAWDWAYLDIQANPSHSSAQSLQRFVMATFYFATDGPNWEVSTDWLDFDSHECDWYYVGNNVSCADGVSLKELLLYENGLVGSIPPEISLLSSLTGVDLQSNQIQASLPSEIGLLSILEFLAVGNNDLTGTIPLEIYNISTLRGLGLQANDFSGSLPGTELGRLGNLEQLWLNSNKDFSGDIPSEVGLLTSLFTLALNHNSMNGTIPSEIARIKSLEQLWLNDNTFDGALPSEMGLLGNLTNMTLSNNKFSQGIPSEFGLLSNLEWMRIAENQLTGPIPSEFGSLSKLRVLSLGINGLTQAVPLELWQLTGLGELRLHSNFLTGFIPPAVANMTELFALSLFSNSFSGSLPTLLAGLAKLDELLLGDNSFTGLLPSELGLLPLFALDLAENRFTGSLPLELANLGALQELWLYSNTLIGDIPSELGVLTRMTDLNLEDNLFNKTIPSELGLLSNSLTSLSVGKNDLVGQLPSELAQLTRLEHLAFDNTLIFGMPSELGLLHKLQTFSASQAGLIGTLPVELGTLTNLREVLLAKNTITGSIPSEWSGMTSLERLHLENNGITGALPSEIGSAWQRLHTLVLVGNSLDQTIPTEFGQLVSLKQVALSQNDLTGPLPSELGLLVALEAFHAPANKISGPLPSELGQVTTLQDFVMSFNELTGTLPSALSSLANLTRIHLNGNEITGNVPAGVCELDWQEMLVDCEELICSCGCSCAL